MSINFTPMTIARCSVTTVIASTLDVPSLATCIRVRPSTATQYNGDVAVSCGVVGVFFGIICDIRKTYDSIQRVSKNCATGI